MRPVHKVDHSPPSILKVKSEWICNSTPPTRLHSVDRKTFTFPLVRLFNLCLVRICSLVSHPDGRMQINVVFEQVSAVKLYDLRRARYQGTAKDYIMIRFIIITTTKYY